VGERVKKPSLHFCNILEFDALKRHLWRFTVGNNQVALAEDQKLSASQPLPSKAVVKDWRSLWQSKLNIAWLPADQVFLRVVHLPASDPTELVSMVEFQMEKLSPIPVNQIVWSMEVLPQKLENLQTVVVVIAARALIEEFLGVLETHAYLPDRLELPFLQELLSREVDGDGAWIYPSIEGGKEVCFVAWWYGGALQQLQLLHLPSGQRKISVLTEQLTKTSWAGEMEGWLTSRAKWHLVASPELVSEWERALTEWSGEAVEVTHPLAETDLAQLTASRAARGESHANLLPPEHAGRYRQQFIDRLWMTALGAVIGTYFLGVLIYFGALQVVRYQHYTLEKQVAALSPQYTNAVKLREHVDVLQNQLNLKFAALDSLKIASELLPAELTLTRFAFSKGQTVTLEGSAPADQSSQLLSYNQNLRKATVNAEPLFGNVEQPSWSARGQQQIAWRFTCELSRTDSE
jgi:hypothetical protein